jgi:rhamnulokinase
MSHHAKFVAADLGASNGRVMVGQWDGNRFSLEELHRFPNGGISAENGLYWDVLGIWGHLQEGMTKYSARFGDSPDGIGVDAWGVDFGLLDKYGRLIGNPVHYRDRRTQGVPAHLFATVAEREVFTATGTQTMEINTLFQLYSMVQKKDVQLAWADKLLMIPDLFLYFLSGEKNIEYTAATTTQMYSLTERRWAERVLEKVGISTTLFPKVISPGTVLAPVRLDVLRHCGFEKPIPAIAVASHDTASAVAAIPNMDASSAFISSGTWSLIGVEAAEPNTSDEAMRLNFTNEGGADGAVLLLKNITGLWTLHQCMHHWKLRGQDIQWIDIIRAASAAKVRSLFDPDDGRLQVQSDMPAAIQSYCRGTRQAVPETIGEIARCAFESLSLKYRSALESLELLTGRDLRILRVVGGGCLNAFLCQMTADACNRLVVAGPVEASALGNVMLQAIATGHLRDIQTGRAAIAASVECVSYEPRPSAGWDEASAKFKCLESRLDA